MEQRDSPYNFHTYKSSTYGCIVDFVMIKDEKHYSARSETDTFTCMANKLGTHFCKFCDFETDLKVLLNDHICVFHEDKVLNSDLRSIFECYQCENCDFRTYSLLVLLKHCFSCGNALEIYSEMQSKHVIVSYDKWFEYRSEGARWRKCKKCRYKTVYKSHIRRHVVSKHGDPKIINWFKCEHCTYKCKRKDHLLNHSSAKHTGAKDTKVVNSTKKQSKFISKETNASESDNSGWYEDRSSRDISWWKCKYCPYKTVYKSHVRRHVELKHGDPKVINWLKCEQCPYQCKGKDYLLNHIVAKHTNPRDTRHAEISINQQELTSAISEHATTDDDKWYEDKSSEDVKWWKCKHCSFQTIHKTSIKSHFVSKHSKPQDILWYNCTECQFKAKQKSNLKTHISITHRDPEDIKQFKCEYCLFTTKYKFGLKNHVTLKHGAAENANWFVCVHCSYKCNHKGTLKRHILAKHTNVEEILWFECEQCSFKTKQKSSLNRHVSLQHADPQDIIWFQCEACFYKCKLKSDLKKHVSLKHKLVQI